MLLLTQDIGYVNDGQFGLAHCIDCIDDVCLFYIVSKSVNQWMNDDK